MRARSLLFVSILFVTIGCSPTSGGRAATGSGGSGGGYSTGGSSGTGGSPTGSGGDSAGGSSGSGGTAGTRVDAATATGGAAADAGRSAPDAATSDGAAGTDGSGAGGVGCTGVMASFCDDLEAQTVGQTPRGAFTVKNGGGATFAIDDSKAYSGTRSAHIHVPKGAGGTTDPTAQMTFNSQFPVAMNDLHGRVMVFLTKNPNDSGKPNIHWDLLSANGGGKTYTLGSMYNDRAKAGAFMPVYQPGDRSIDTSTPFPEGMWACVQWQFRQGGTGGDLLELKMNGKVVDLGATTAEGAPINGGHVAAWPAGPWSRLVFGYVHFSSPTPIDVDLWFDDLAFGPQEITCPPPR
jgi:hypothetical protein